MIQLWNSYKQREVKTHLAFCLKKKKEYKMHTRNPLLTNVLWADFELISRAPLGLHWPSGSSQLTDILLTINICLQIYAPSMPDIKKFKMMGPDTDYLCCTCQIWSHCPVCVDERPKLAEGSKSNSRSNWGDCQSKAELTQSQEKPIRFTSRRREREHSGYVRPFNRADRDTRSNKQTESCMTLYVLGNV